MTNKYIYFIANWKMFGNLQSLNSVSKVVSFVKRFKKNKIKLVYCPPTTLINLFSKKLKSSLIEVGAQNCHQSFDNGPYTGQVNSRMLKSVGAKYVIIGHSENRQLGDNDKLINLKIKSATRAGLKVIFCIGETLEQKKSKKTNNVLANQIKNGLKSKNNKSNIIVAYEPVWSIGSGLIPKSDELIKSIAYIKSKLGNKSIKILYGGSVNSNNVDKLKIITGIDGFLIGGASQNSKKFIDIIKKTIN